MEIRDYFDESSCESVDERIDTERVIANLPLREKQILYLYVTEHTQAEIGAIVGLSQRRVGQILQNISKSTSQLKNI
jgi:DNA-directed RNA polymerase specialized sigma subunit